MKKIIKIAVVLRAQVSKVNQGTLTEMRILNITHALVLFGCQISVLNKTSNVVLTTATH